MPIQELSIEAIKGGEDLRRLNTKIQQAVANCLDPEMPIKGKRTVFTEIKIVPRFGSRERPFITAETWADLPEKAEFPEVLQVKLVKKLAYIENAAQEPLCDKPMREIPVAPFSDLESLDDGQTLARINLELQRAVGNLCNLDMPIKPARTVLVKLVFENKDETGTRRLINCTPDVIPKFPHETIRPVLISVKPSAELLEGLTPVYDETSQTTQPKEESYV